MTLMMAKLCLGQSEQHCTVHCTYGQLVVLYCAADQSSKSLCDPKSHGQIFLQNLKQGKFQSLLNFVRIKKCQK